MYALAYFMRAFVWDAKGEHDRAIADYDEAIRLDREDARSYFNRRLRLVVEGDLDRAIADFGEAIRVDPKYTRAYGWRGDAWYEKEEYDKAIADYTEEIRLDPVSAVAYYDRGAPGTRRANTTSPWLTTTSASTPIPKTLAYPGRAFAWDAKGEYDRAIADYDASIRIDPGRACAYYIRV